MKKFVVSLLVFVLLATTVIGAVSAQGGTTFVVVPYDDGQTYTVPSGDAITLRWAWLATTRGLVNVFLRSFSASYTIYDAANNPIFVLSEAQADPMWGPIQQFDPSAYGIECPMPHHWYSFWESGVGHLAPGTYTLVTQWSFSRPVNDGWHLCSEPATGQPPASPPSLNPPGSGAWTVTIVVQ